MEASSSLSELRAAVGELTLLLRTAKTNIVKEVLEEAKKKAAEKLETLTKASGAEAASAELKVENPQGAETEAHQAATGLEGIQSLPAKTSSPKDSAKSTKTQYKNLPSYAWDQDGYNGKNVFVYITLKNVGSVKESVSCDFTENSFDVKVMNLDGVNYRLIKQPLNKDIVPEKCKFRVKKDRIVITLKKSEGKYGTDHWADLTEKGKGTKAARKSKEDPSAGLMEMMKQMYDDGDDQMKKTIGEAMMKSRQENPMKFGA